MNLNLNTAIDDVLEWDFSITLNNRTVATRPLTLADVAALMRVGQSGNPEKMMDTAVGMFQEPPESVREWVGTWRPEHLSGAIAAVIEYLKETIRKNSPAVASKVATAMKAQTP